MPNIKIIYNSELAADPKTLLSLNYDAVKELVFYACRKYHQHPMLEEIEDLRNDIAYYLLNDNSHYLRTFDPKKASFKTWLTCVVEHFISNYFKHQRSWDNLKETLPERFLEEPKQELNSITKEKQEAVTKEISKLTSYQQNFINLICDDLSVSEIAQRLSIKPESVYWMKHQIIQKIQVGLHRQNGGGANSVPEHQNSKIKINQNNDSRFSAHSTIRLIASILNAEIYVWRKNFNVGEISIHYFKFRLI